MEKRIRKVGEEVVLKTFSEMADECGRSKDGTVYCNFGIIPQMEELLGKKYTITKVSELNGIPCYNLDNMHWCFSEDMIKEEKEEEEDILTVVLVSRIHNKSRLIEDKWILTKETLERRKEEFKNDEENSYMFEMMRVY